VLLPHRKQTHNLSNALVPSMFSQECDCLVLIIKSNETSSAAIKKERKNGKKGKRIWINNLGRKGQSENSALKIE
jgi:hypothetical protein